MAAYTPQDAPRAARNTLIQGLVAATVTGAITGGLEVLDAGDFTWRTVGITVASATLASLLAYVQHAYAAPYLRIRKQVRGDRAA